MSQTSVTNFVSFPCYCSTDWNDNKTWISGSLTCPAYIPFFCLLFSRGINKVKQVSAAAVTASALLLSGSTTGFPPIEAEERRWSPPLTMKDQVSAFPSNQWQKHPQCLQLGNLTRWLLIVNVVSRLEDELISNTLIVDINPRTKEMHWLWEVGATWEKTLRLCSTKPTKYPQKTLLSHSSCDWQLLVPPPGSHMNSLSSDWSGTAWSIWSVFSVTSAACLVSSRLDRCVIATISFRRSESPWSGSRTRSDREQEVSR